MRRLFESATRTRPSFVTPAPNGPSNSLPPLPRLPLAMAQRPATQMASAPQARPQAPQLPGSASRSTHCPLQSSNGQRSRSSPPPRLSPRRFLPLPFLRFLPRRLASASSLIIGAATTAPARVATSSRRVIPSPASARASLSTCDPFIESSFLRGSCRHADDAGIVPTARRELAPLHPEARSGCALERDRLLPARRGDACTARPGSSRSRNRDRDGGRLTRSGGRSGRTGAPGAAPRRGRTRPRRRSRAACRRASPCRSPPRAARPARPAGSAGR